MADCPNSSNIQSTTRSPCRHEKDLSEAELSEYGTAMMRAARESRCQSIHLSVEGADRANTPTGDDHTHSDSVDGDTRPAASAPSVCHLSRRNECRIDSPEPQHCVSREDLLTTSHIRPHPIPDGTVSWTPSPKLVSLKRRVDSLVRRIGEDTTDLEKNIANVTRRLELYAKSPSFSAGSSRHNMGDEEWSQEVHSAERTNGS